MHTRTKGIHLATDGSRMADKIYRGQRIYERLGLVSQDDAEKWLRQRQEQIDAEEELKLRRRIDQLFRVAAGKYLLELQERGDVRSLETIAGHVTLLNHWVGDVPLSELCNDSFAAFKSDRLAGRDHLGMPVRKVKPVTINRSLEVARTVANRAARVWRMDKKPWLTSAPLIEMLDESQTRRPPRPISWAEQNILFPLLPQHLRDMALFAVNTGARDENICGLRWEWEVKLPELGRSVFAVPAIEYKGKRVHVLVLNDVAWDVVERQRWRHDEFVFVYRREYTSHKKIKEDPKMKFRRIETMNNTGFQNARRAAGLTDVRVHDLRHTFGQRLRAAGVSGEDRSAIMGHTTEGMAEHYATSTVDRLIKLANSVNSTTDQTTLLQVVNRRN